MSSQCGRTGAMWRRLIRSLWILSRHSKWKHLADGWGIFRSWSSINTRLIVRGWPSHHHQLAVSCHNYTLDNYELDNYSNPVRNPFSRRCSRYFVVACLCSPLHFTSLRFSPPQRVRYVNHHERIQLPFPPRFYGHTKRNGHHHHQHQITARNNINGNGAVAGRTAIHVHHYSNVLGHPFNCPLPIYPRSRHRWALKASRFSTPPPSTCPVALSLDHNHNNNTDNKCTLNATARVEQTQCNPLKSCHFN